MSRNRVRSLAVIAAASALACGVVFSGVPAYARDGVARPPEVLKAALDVLAWEGKAGKAQYWYIDRATGKVVISILDGLPDPVTQAFLATALPGEAVVSTVSLPIVPMVGHIPAGQVTATAQAGGTLYAGQSIEMTWGTGGSVCTSGFNQQDVNGVPRTLTAGHCGNGVLGNGWHVTGGDTFGYIKESHYPGADWSSISQPSADPAWQFPWAVKQAGGLPNQPINSYAQPYVGENLCATGQTSGTKCGKVTATNVTVNYSQGPIYGTAQTTIAAGPGDSGGPVYNGSIGVGLVSGGPQGGGPPTYIYPAPCDPGRPSVCS